MSHPCGTCGLEHQVDEPIAEVVEEAVAADAAVTIAEIEAGRDVELAKISAKVSESYNDTEIEKLRAELNTMREMLDRMTPPEPEPVPIVVDAAPEPEPMPEPVAAVEPPPLLDEPPRQKKRGNPFWT